MKSYIKNYILNLSYQILIIVLPLATAPYLSRVLGADRIGEYSFAQSVVAYFALFSGLGTSLYGQRTIARCHADGGAYRKTFFEIVWLRFASTGLFLLLYLSMVFAAANNKWLFLLAGIEILSVAVDISWFFQGIEQFGKITYCNGLTKLLGAAAIFLFVHSREDLEIYVLLFTGSTLLGYAAQWLFVQPYLKGEKEKLAPGRHLKAALLLFLPQFAINAYTVLDKTMIGLITRSDFENGFYEQTQKLIRVLTTIVTAIGAVMASRVAFIWKENAADKEEKIKELLIISFRIVFGLGLPMMAGTMLIASRFIPIYYGDGYEPVIRLIRWLAVIVPIVGCSNVVGMQLFVPSGRENLLTRSVIIGAVVNVFLNLCLIRAYGAYGAVIGSIIAEMTVTGVQFYYARRELPWKDVGRELLRYGAATILMSLLGFYLAGKLSTGIMGLLGVVVFCVVIYLGFLFLIKDPLFSIFKRGES